MKLLVPGGCGFIGSAFCRLAIDRGYQVTAFDKLTYAGDPANLPPDVPLIIGDIADRESLLLAADDVDAIVNFAAGSHVDQAIINADPFVVTNIIGVQNIIEVTRQLNLRLVQVSSDEVYGPIPKNIFVDEDAPLRPGNGYAATKAAGDLLVLAAHNTYDIDVCITRCVNNYGPRQHPEKLIPKSIIKAINGDYVPVFSDGSQVRDWISVNDHCRAILTVLKSGVPGQVYNISMQQEQRNIDVVRQILNSLNKPTTLIKYVPDRPGHDVRYGISNVKIRDLGWTPEDVNFDLSLTIDWYSRNKRWWQSKVG